MEQLRFMTKASIDSGERLDTPQSSPGSREGKQSNIGSQMISPDGRDDRCYNCGGFGHYSRDCPFRSSPRNIRCFTCGERGHTQRKWPHAKRRFHGSTNNSPPNRQNKFITNTSSPNGDGDRNNSRRN